MQNKHKRKNKFEQTYVLCEQDFYPPEDNRDLASDMGMNVIDSYRYYEFREDYYEILNEWEYFD